jgi:hypothetical protein
MSLFILQGMEDFPKSVREVFSQASLYFGNCCSALNPNANFSFQLKLWDLVRVS